MPNSFFQFKHFTVFHDNCAMKVTTDSVILGAWTDVKDINNALDIGTGTGLLALMVAQRSHAIIDAVEEDEAACRQALTNIKNSPWDGRINLINDTIQHFCQINHKIYDLIISNPPYFQHSLKSPDKRRSAARHNISLSYEELLMITNKLLAPQGKFSLIIPAAESDNFIELAFINKLYPSRITLIRSFPNSAFSRVLIEFGFNRVNTILRNELVIHNKTRKYSDEYISLTRDFYLNF